MSDDVFVPVRDVWQTIIRPGDKEAFTTLQDYLFCTSNVDITRNRCLLMVAWELHRLNNNLEEGNNSIHMVRE